MHAHVSSMFATAVLAALSLSAFAAQRTFVASTGSDLNPCSLASPCRSFNTAITAASAGGEVVVLDTAAYGPMTINKSIKIIAPSGVYGGISVLGGASGVRTGVVINATSSDDIALSGLNINAVPGSAPLPLFGIDVQSASTVHIDRVTVTNFTDPAAACIDVAPTTTVRVYINDSLLRECRTGVNANGTAVPVSGDPLVLIVDNTRIERGRATSGLAYGLWVQGFVGASVRNSLITLHDVGIQIDNLATNGTTLLAVSQTQVAGGGTGLNVASASAGGVPLVSIVGSQFIGSDDAIIFSHSAAGTAFGGQLKVADSSFAYISNGGITASTGADAGINMDLVRSQLNFTGNTAISMAASSTSGINLNLRDSTLSNATTLLKTSGTSGINATLIRSHLHNSVTAVDHGRGRIRLEQTNVSNNGNSLVNNGSGNIVSAGNNWIVDNADSTPLTVYITPTIIPMK